jgi:hypothetical protein
MVCVCVCVCGPETRLHHVLVPDQTMVVSYVLLPSTCIWFLTSHQFFFLSFKAPSHSVLRTLVLSPPNKYQASHLGPKPISPQRFYVKFRV